MSTERTIGTYGPESLDQIVGRINFLYQGVLSEPPFVRSSLLCLPSKECPTRFSVQRGTALGGFLRQTVQLRDADSAKDLVYEQALFLLNRETMTLRTSAHLPASSGYRNATVGVAVYPDGTARGMASMLFTPMSIVEIKRLEQFRSLRENEFLRLAAVPDGQNPGQIAYYLATPELDDEDWPRIDPAQLQQLGISVPEVAFHHPLQERFRASTLSIPVQQCDMLRLSISLNPYLPLDPQAEELLSRFIQGGVPLMQFKIQGPEVNLKYDEIAIPEALAAFKQRQIRVLH